MTPEKLIPGHPDTMSANLVTKNIAQLATAEMHLPINKGRETI